MSGRVLSSALKCASIGCAVGLTYGVVRGLSPGTSTDVDGGLFEAYTHICADPASFTLLTDLSTYRMYDVDTFDRFVKYFNLFLGVQHDRECKPAGRALLAQFYSCRAIDALRVMRKRIEVLSPDTLADTDAIFKKIQSQITDYAFNITMQQMADMDR